MLHGFDKRSHLVIQNALASEEFQEMKTDVKHPTESFLKAYRNKKFLVQLFKEKDDIIRMSINRTKLKEFIDDWQDGITWDEIQNIKDRLGYEDRCGVELYPPRANIVNVANIRHIFLLKTPPSYMWDKQPEKQG